MEENRVEYKTVDEYIAAFEPEVRRILETLRREIRETAPEAKEKISYQIPTYEQRGNLVHFAAFKGHIGFYPGASGIAAFQEELSGYKGAKGTVRFPIDKPLPYELIRRIVRYRVAENEERAAAKALRKKKSAEGPGRSEVRNEL